MESKKINQLATELAPVLSDLTIIGDPTTGISRKITLSQMASLFTGTVEEYPNLASFPLVGTADTIYIALDTNIIYRWNTGTNAYVELSPNIVTSLVFNDANGFDGTINLVGSTATLTITTALTQGSVPFIGTSGALTQDNANLFFDDTNNRLGINTNAPTTALDVFGSGIIGRLNGTSTNNAFLGFANAGTNRWSIGNVQSDHRFRIYSETNTSELVTVLQTGEFGIGIANPTTKFHIDGAATALIANLDANVSVAKSLSFRSDNSNRINLEVSGTESGSNAGADFFLRTFTDAGSLLETPFTIVRSTGVTTIKSLTLTNVLSVPNGGTGITSLTTGYIPFGNGTSAFNSSANLFWDNTNTRLGIGTTPNYQLQVLKNQTIATIISVDNNTGNAASHASLLLHTGGATSGDPYIYLNNEVTSWSIGCDNSDSDKFKISQASTLGTNDHFTISNLGVSIFGYTAAVGTNFSPPVQVKGGAGTGNGFGIISANNEMTGGIQLSSSGSNSLTITADPDGLRAGSEIGFAIDGSQKAVITSDGFVGIDTNATTAKLGIGRTANTESNIFLSRQTNSADVNIGCIRATLGPFWYDGTATSLAEINLQTDTTAYFKGAIMFSTNNSDATANRASLRMYINAAGSIGTTKNGTNIYNASDIRLKRNIETIELGLDKILQLNPVKFNWVDGFAEDGKDMLGFIAQEVKDIIPEAVEDFGGEDNIVEIGDLKVINPLRINEKFIIPVLVKSIQELKAEIDLLKAK